MATPAPPRQILIAKPTAASRQSGVLPVHNAATTNRNANASQRNREAKLKVLVRRLAPGLTEEEFRAALGDEWKVGGGKVDWTSYQKGKIAKDAAKPSRPSRAYLHLTHPQHVGPLADKIRTTTFTDAKGSFNDSVLLGPPTLFFTPFSKIPGKARVDGRQGTIDQDPEFIEFLASLTNPVTKPLSIDAVADKESKPTDTKIITPLVQYIKDKKANKAKEGKSQKHGRQESKDNKTDDKKSSGKGGKGKAAAIDKKSSTSAKVEKAKPESTSKATKNSQAASNAQTTASPPTQTPTQPTNPSQPKPERRRERGNASVAAKILQRDLAIASGASGRRRRDNSNAASDTSAQKAVVPIETPTQAPTVSQETVTTAAAANTLVQPPSGPAATRKAQSQNASTQQANPAPAKTSPTVSPTATQAFLKHANPSQGVTEPLLEEAFKTFGNVTKVEIDKKKGFAYVDFAEPSGLQKAIAASPVKVAQGQVVVLERKTGAVLQNRNARGQQGSNTPVQSQNRGGRGGGRGRSGRSHPNTPKVANATPTSNPSPAPAPAPAPTPVTAPT